MESEFNNPLSQEVSHILSLRRGIRDAAHSSFVWQKRQQENSQQTFGVRSTYNPVLGTYLCQTRTGGTIRARSITTSSLAKTQWGSLQQSGQFAWVDAMPR